MYIARVYYLCILPVYITLILAGVHALPTDAHADGPRSFFSAGSDDARPGGCRTASSGVAGASARAAAGGGLGSRGSGAEIKRRPLLESPVRREGARGLCRSRPCAAANAAAGVREVLFGRDAIRRNFVPKRVKGSLRRGSLSILSNNDTNHNDNNNDTLLLLLLLLLIIIIIITTRRKGSLRRGSPPREVRESPEERDPRPSGNNLMNK